MQAQSDASKELSMMVETLEEAILVINNGEVLYENSAFLTMMK